MIGACGSTSSRWGIFCLLVSLASVAPMDAAAQGLDVVLSCPVWDPGPPEVGNDPGAGLDAQPNPVVFGPDERVVCQILYGNSSGAPISNVRFDLALPSLPDATLVDVASLPDGNPLDAARGQGMVFGVEDQMAQLVEAVPGFLDGAWDPAGQVFTWDFAVLDAGESGQLRVFIDADTLYADTGTITLTTTALGVAVTPKTAPVEYDGSYIDYVQTSLAPVTTAPSTFGNLGAKHMLSVDGAGRRHADVVLELDLPYWDASTATARADGAYDAFNPAHVLFHDPTKLEAALVFEGDITIATLDEGAAAGPTSGPNANAVLRYDAVTNRVTATLGSPEAHVDLRWRAPLAGPQLIAGRSIPHSQCWRSSTQPRTCITSASTTFAPESHAVPLTYYDGRSYGPSGPLTTNGVTEASALVSSSPRFSQYFRVSNPSTDSLSDFQIVAQVPGDTQQRARFEFADWSFLRFLDPNGGHAIHVSTTPTQFGSAADISARVVPQPAATWIRCDDALGQPSYRCGLAELAALGIAPASVQEVRFSVPELPSSWMGSVNPNIPARAAEFVEIGWVLDGAVDSIDASSGYDPNTLDGRSVGNKAVVSWVTSGGETFSQVLPRSAEVSDVEVDALLRVEGVGPDTWQTPIAPQLTAAAQPALWGFRFFNEGALANVFGPFVFTAKLPQGFELDATRFFPFEPERPRVRVGRSDGAGGIIWDWNDAVLTQQSYVWNPLTREYSVTIEPTQQGVLGPSQDRGQGPPPAGQVADVIVYVYGEILIGAPRRLQIIDPVLSAEVVESGERVRRDFPLVAGEFDVSSVNPALSLEVDATPDVVGALDLITYDFILDNIAYRDDGSREVNGATGSARDAAVFQRVTRAGDHPGVEQGRAASLFVRAEPVDAGVVWVSVDDNPTRTTAGALDAANGWIRCASAPAVCDDAALAAVNTSSTDVRWVAFTFDEVLVTDAEPRGRAPRAGRSRENVPYRSRLIVRDDASNQDALIRTNAELDSLDSARATTGFVDVRVDAYCQSTLPNIGFDQPELCDGIDNDCDRLVDEVFNPGMPCNADFDGCTIPGVTQCQPGGQATFCDISAEPDADADGYPDQCDCAATNPGRFDMVPGTDTTCDYDGDGDCNAQISGLNAAVCLGGVNDCNDFRPNINSRAIELCDSEDNDCDMLVDEDFPDIGQACTNGFGKCERMGTLFCSGDGLGTACDAVPGSPEPESCDGIDNDCDALIDEDFSELGQPCTNGDGLCENDGVYICALDGVTVRCDAIPLPPQPELCDALDNNCDGVVDDGFDVGAGCFVPFPGGCQAPGALACAEDGRSSVCEITDPEDTDSDGFPDVCDCAPVDPFRATLAAGAPGSCDFDGDGSCNELIPDLNAALCSSPLDCNDAVAEIFPGAPERCDGLDNDCDVMVDEDFPDLGQACSAGAAACRNDGMIRCSMDGAATECSAVPGMLGSAEVCDANDNDCDAMIDEDFPDLGQGCSVEFDGCVMAGALGCSEDGAGTTCLLDQPSDVDADGVPDACDCAPREPTFASGMPGAPTSCDADSDGYCSGAILEPNLTLCPMNGDCNDSEPEIYPGAPEACDGIDSNCDGDDDEIEFGLGALCEVGVGACAAGGVVVCTADGTGSECGATPGAPELERCDGLDNDCDAMIDEDFSELGESCSAGSGACVAQGAFICADDGASVVCDASPGDPQSDELCNGVDDDCDGDIDEGFALDQPCLVGLGECSRDGVTACNDAGDGVECVGRPGEPSAELCDGLDNDCDGEFDERDDCEPGEPDSDGDGRLDTMDNCPDVPNPNQLDADMDGVGDACEEPEQPPTYGVYGTGFCAAAPVKQVPAEGALLGILGALCVGVTRRRRRV